MIDTIIFKKINDGAYGHSSGRFCPASVFKFITEDQNFRASDTYFSVGGRRVILFLTTSQNILRKCYCCVAQHSQSAVNLYHFSASSNLTASFGCQMLEPNFKSNRDSVNQADKSPTLRSKNKVESCLSFKDIQPIGVPLSNGV